MKPMSFTKDDLSENQLMRGLSYAALESIFSVVEWLRLSSTDCKKVSNDFIQAGISTSEYKGRISSGNLQKYANCL